MTNWGELSPKRLAAKYKEGQLKIRLNWISYSILFLLIITLVASMISSASIHVICASFDFHAIFGAKFEFREKENVTFTDIEAVKTVRRAIEMPKIPTIVTDHDGKIVNGSSNDEKINRKKVKHLFSMNENSDDIFEVDNDEGFELTTIKVKVDNKDDFVFLSTMQIDEQRTIWSHSGIMDYLLYYPFITEIVAIIWATMTIIYQSGAKNHWALPQPWSIVIPSMVIFFLMSISSLVYSIVNKNAVINFCDDLKINLTNPDGISCGVVIQNFRLNDYNYALDYDTYLKMIYQTNVITTICWMIAFIIMLVRFFCAVDFQLITVAVGTHRELNESPSETDQMTRTTHYDPESTAYEVSPKILIQRSKSRDDDEAFHSTESNLNPNSTDKLSLRSDLKEDDDDFYSTKSVPQSSGGSLQPLLSVEPSQATMDNDDFLSSKSKQTVLSAESSKLLKPRESNT